TAARRPSGRRSPRRRSEVGSVVANDQGTPSGPPNKPSSLSERLAALEDDVAESRTTSGVAVKPVKRNRMPLPEGDDGNRRLRRASSSWDSNKRKVRDLVVTEVAPRMAGLHGEALVDEV